MCLEQQLTCWSDIKLPDDTRCVGCKPAQCQLSASLSPVGQGYEPQLVIRRLLAGFHSACLRQSNGPWAWLADNNMFESI